MPERLLILGGTAEAAALARTTAAQFGDRLTLITSLAGRLPERPDLPGLLRSGGFGGADGLAAYLAAERIDRLIDATHPFAAAISQHAADACARRGVPRLALVRPPWTRVQGDRWVEVADADEAAARLPQIARRIFLTTGPGALPAFAGLEDAWFLVRLFASPAAPLPLCRYQALVERPPFSVDGERTLMSLHRIEAVVTKNSGGPTGAKLAAARMLGLPVVMIRRPPLPSGDRVDSVEAALAWLGR